MSIALLITYWQVRSKKVLSKRQVFERIVGDIRHLAEAEQYLVSEGNFIPSSFKPPGSESIGLTARTRENRSYFAAYKLSFSKQLNHQIEFIDSMMPVIGQIRIPEVSLSYNICGDIRHGFGQDDQSAVSDRTRHQLRGQAADSKNIAVGFSTKEGLMRQLQNPKCYRKCKRADCGIPWDPHLPQDIPDKNKRLIIYFSFSSPLFTFFPESPSWSLLSPSDGLMYDVYFPQGIFSSSEERQQYLEKEFDAPGKRELDKQLGRFVPLPEQKDLAFSILLYSFEYLH